MHSRGTRLFEVLAADVRYAWRGLRNAPGYAVTIVLTLALGLGVVTSMLAIVDSVLLRPVALPHPEQLVLMNMQGKDGRGFQFNFDRIGALRRETHLFSAISAYNTTVRPVTANDGARIALLTYVSPDFFAMLGVHASLGRLFGSADDRAPVAVVSSFFWRDRLHADPKVLGSIVRISGQDYTVVGVLESGVRFPQGTEAQTVYLPMSLKPGGAGDLFIDNSATVMVRMKPHVSLSQALEEAQSVIRHVDQESPADRGTVQLTSYASFLTGNVRSGLLALLGGAGVLLLIACANAANLQIARATSRIAEMNTRSALGATFARLVQQIVTESLLVSLIGAMLGGALAYAIAAVIRHAYGLQFTRFDEIAIHPSGLLACIALAIVAGVLASLAPVISVRRQTGIATASTRATRRSSIPAALVAFQIALTCVLLITGGLFVRTLLALEKVKLGFDPRGVTTLVVMPENQHADPEATRQNVSQLIEKLNTLPGIQSATMQSSVPFSSFNVSLNGTTDVEGRIFREGDSAFYSMVSTNFVRASGIHLIEGRGFTKEDDGSGAMVALVNQAFLKQFLPHRKALGVTIKPHHAPNDKDVDMPFSQSATIVGIVENELQGGDLGATDEPMVYFDYIQMPKSSGIEQVFNFADEFAIRSSLPQATLDKEIRAAIKQTAPDMAEMSLQSMEGSIADSLNQRRLALRLVSAFGGSALLLAAIGIYGVLAYSVAHRRKEIGIRMALGSSRAGAIRLIFRQAGSMVLFGIVAGGLGAWPASRMVQSFLYGAQALDPWTIAAATLLLLLVCGLATLAPAWRAAQVDPMEVLRSE